MSICGCDALKVDTIQSLIDGGRDVLTEIVPSSEIYAEEKREELLSIYRFRMIGSCDPDRWIRAMQDRVATLRDKWDVRISMWMTASRAEDFGELTDRSRKLLEVTDTTVTDTTDTEREDIPETADAMESRYLSERGLTDRDVIGKVSRDLNETERNGLAPELLRRSMDSIPDVLHDWADEFADLFLRMW